jgi:penicillin-binding protein 1C
MHGQSSLVSRFLNIKGKIYLLMLKKHWEELKSYLLINKLKNSVLRIKTSKFFKKRVVKILLSIFVLGLILDFCFPFKVKEDYSTVILDRDNRILSAYLNNDQKWRFRCSQLEVSPFFIKAIIEKEDKYFYFHPGVNPIAIIRATFSNLKKQKRVSGASTITMQVVRLVNPSKRTYFNKFIETFRAIQLEIHYSKNEILSLYLNHIPLGSNIEGIKAASYIYLDKHPSKLSLAEAMILCLIPNKPSLLQANKKTELEEFKKKWLSYFEQNMVFEKSEVIFAKNEVVTLTRKTLNKIAPHFCQRLKNNSPESPYISSTLNTNLQLQVETQIVNHLDRLKPIGVQNAMAIVIDNRTMQVLVYCGSGNYKNKNDGGQVDGIKAVRSPGSALKPYLYAMAMEKGLVNPKALLYDIPSDFGGFKPVNFDNVFTGQVSMRDALQQSLNIPAVKMLENYGLTEFILDLKKAKFKSIKDNEEKLGLSTILGGCGVTMEEMVKLYASFANGGQYQELCFQKKNLENSIFKNENIFGQFFKNNTEQYQLIDETSAYIISDILSGLQRPDFPNNFDFTFKLPKIAWKTGTSFGKRDAWALGYNPNFTVGVWLGNFLGESIPQLSGASVATPLLFQIFNTVETSKKWFKKPENIIYKEVCAVSGLPKNTFCKTTQIDNFIGGVFYKNKCQHLKNVWVNANESLSYCSKCMDRTNAIQKQYINFPVEYTEFLSSNGMAYEKIPTHNPECNHIVKSQQLSIISPKTGSLFYIENHNSQEILLKANASFNTKWLFWFHNNQLLGKYNASESVFIKPRLGQNKITCTDEFGKSVHVVFEAKAM